MMSPRDLRALIHNSSALRNKDGGFSVYDFVTVRSQEVEGDFETHVSAKSWTQQFF